MKKTSRWMGYWVRLAVWVALVPAMVAACADVVTPPGADKAMGSFGQAGYLFLRWQEGLEVMIWHDLAGEGTGHSAGSNAGRLYVERGSVRSTDGRNLAWELQTADGRTGEVQIDGIRYDLADGTLFIVTTRDGTTAVRQLHRDLSAVPLDHDRILAFARNDPDLAPLLNENMSAAPPSVTATPPPAMTVTASATPVPTVTLRPPTRTPSPAPAAERIRFPPGATQALIEGDLPEDGSAIYVVKIAADQFIEVNATVGAMGQGLRCSIVGADGFVVQPMGEAHVQAVVPSTQDYTIKLVSDVGAARYRLSLLIPVRIHFAPGATSATVAGSLKEGGVRHYVLAALAGQRLNVAPHAATGQVGMVISGVDGQVLLSGRVGTPGGVYDGMLPTTQDYLIAVQARGGIGADYTLEITIPAEGEPEITIAGTVRDVSLSARVIALTEPVDRFSVVALTVESRLLSAGGNEIALRDIRPAMRIQASGLPGESQALLASEVRVLP